MSSDITAPPHFLPSFVYERQMVGDAANPSGMAIRADALPIDGPRLQRIMFEARKLRPDIEDKLSRIDRKQGEQKQQSRIGKRTIAAYFGADIVKAFRLTRAELDQSAQEALSEALALYLLAHAKPLPPSLREELQRQGIAIEGQKSLRHEQSPSPILRHGF